MILHSGPDPDFPYLNEHECYRFPSPSAWKGNIIAFGGNLSPGMLLSAYTQGIFPWYNPEDPILWQSPDPRMVIFPEKLHISRTMRRILENELFTITINRDFNAVIRNCAGIKRPGQDGTWINNDIIAAYNELHHLGWALSAEAWLNGELAGGCYGIHLGRVFCGESMFTRKPNASKAAFLTLARILFANSAVFIDCQTPTKHLHSLGGETISREEFLNLLQDTLKP